MVGGMVITTIEDGNRIYVNCQERVARRQPETCAIYVVRNSDSEQIRPGDSVWWQGKWAMWTPRKNMVSTNCYKHAAKCGVDFDIQIPRASYSGVKSPMAARSTI